MWLHRSVAESRTKDIVSRSNLLRTSQQQNGYARRRNCTLEQQRHDISRKRLATEYCTLPSGGALDNVGRSATREIKEEEKRIVPPSLGQEECLIMRTGKDRFGLGSRFTLSHH
jgi:hypothetical protein